MIYVKHIAIIGLIILAGIIAIAATANAAGALTNGGAESASLTGWTYTNTYPSYGSISATTSHPDTGSYCFVFTMNNVNQYLDIGNMAITQSADFTGASNLTFRMYVQSSNLYCDAGIYLVDLYIDGVKKGGSPQFYRRANGGQWLRSQWLGGSGGAVLDYDQWYDVAWPTGGLTGTHSVQFRSDFHDQEGSGRQTGNIYLDNVGFDGFDQHNYTIFGYLTDTTFNASLAGKTVNLIYTNSTVINGYSVITNATGGYTITWPITALANGNYGLSVPPTDDYSGVAISGFSIPGSFTNYNLSMSMDEYPRTTSVSLYPTDSVTHVALQSVTYTVRDMSLGGITVLSNSLRANGVLTYPWTDTHNYRVAVTKTNYNTVTLADFPYSVVSGYGFTMTVSTVVTARWKILGQVQDIDYNPPILAGATVVMKYSNGSTIATGTTGPDGWFDLTTTAGAPQGGYYVEIGFAGFQNYVSDTFVAPGMFPNYDAGTNTYSIDAQVFRMTRNYQPGVGQVTFTVFTDGGYLVPQASMSYTSISHGSGTIPLVNGVAYGVYLVYDTYTLTYTAPGYVTATSQLIVDGSALFEKECYIGTSSPVYGGRSQAFVEGLVRNSYDQSPVYAMVIVTGDGGEVKGWGYSVASWGTYIGVGTCNYEFWIVNLTEGEHLTYHISADNFNSTTYDVIFPDDFWIDNPIFNNLVLSHDFSLDYHFGSVIQDPPGQVYSGVGSDLQYQSLSGTMNQIGGGVSVFTDAAKVYQENASDGAYEIGIKIGYTRETVDQVMAPITGTGIMSVIKGMFPWQWVFCGMLSILAGYLLSVFLGR